MQHSLQPIKVVWITATENKFSLHYNFKCRELQRPL